MIGAYNATFGGYYGNAMTTQQMDSILSWLGFTRYDALNTAWADGDIMWRNGHTEFVYNASMYYCMGAHSDEYPLADQVSISNVSTRNYWTYGYRYTPTIQWFAKYTGSYGRLTDEAYANAVMIYNILEPRGWTVNAIAGMLGNIEVEGGYNPWRWQNDNVISINEMNDPYHGYGLFQFDRPNKYINATTAATYSTYAPHYLGNEGMPHDGDAQVKWVDESVGEYFINPNYPYYPLSFSEYKASTNTPEYLALAWMLNFERPRMDIEHFEQRRQEAARYWYNVLQGLPPMPPTPPVPPPTVRRKSPFWVYIYPF